MSSLEHVNPVGAAAARAARAVAAHARSAAKMHNQATELAVVRTVSPLAAELLEGRLTLNDEMLALGYSARKYHEDFGIEEGDSLVVTQLASREYLVLDVLAGKEVRRGAGTEAQAGTTKNLSGSGSDPQGGVVNVTVPMAVSKWLPNFDEDGEPDGFIPVFASKT